MLPHLHKVHLLMDRPSLLSSSMVAHRKIKKRLVEKVKMEVTLPAGKPIETIETTGDSKRLKGLMKKLLVEVKLYERVKI